ncbi:hypothetical protein LX36DRAFT_665908 [Colletotrichum falcatum]|nr:hypothetical protein LX36DRAFT_665908 [Colletotrichum falcatum]
MTESKADKIERVKANLPLPEQPPVAPDWQSADARTVNVGSGRTEAPISGDAPAARALRDPSSTTNVDFSSIGRQGVEGLDGLPRDAIAKKYSGNLSLFYSNISMKCLSEEPTIHWLGLIDSFFIVVFRPKKFRRALVVFEEAEHEMG